MSLVPPYLSVAVWVVVVPLFPLFPLPDELLGSGAFCFWFFFSAAWAFFVLARVLAFVALVFRSMSAVCLAVPSSLIPKNSFTHSQAFLITSEAFSKAFTR